MSERPGGGSDVSTGGRSPLAHRPGQTALMKVQHVNCCMARRLLLEDISFVLERGCRTMVMGANGAGKSLLLRVLHGLTQISAGTIQWCGKPLDRDARRAQAMVFQRPVMLRRTVQANLHFALQVRGIARKQQRQRVRQALQAARLQAQAQQAARSLSGGEQQRLALARALVCQPQLLLLDEPTANLDPASTQAIENLLEIACEQGVSMIMVTHDAGQARRLGQDVLFLHAGRLVERGAVPAVLDAPTSKAAQAWVNGRLLVDV